MSNADLIAGRIFEYLRSLDEYDAPYVHAYKEDDLSDVCIDGRVDLVKMVMELNLEAADAKMFAHLAGVLADALEAAEATALNAAAKELEDEGDAQDNADMLVEWEYKAAAWLRERAKQ
jgi:hypothetical protein